MSRTVTGLLSLIFVVTLATRRQLGELGGVAGALAEAVRHLQVAE